MTDSKTPTTPVVHAENLVKRYRSQANAEGVTALNKMTLSLHTGEFVAVCGPSGCGKSTLLLCLGALMRPDSGTLTVAGTDTSGLSPGQRAAFRAQNIGFVFQDFHLIPYLDVLDNVLAPILAAPTNNPTEQAETLLEKLQLGERRHHVPSALSAGEQQRVALARALMPRPKLLLADEPTGNLDTDNSKRVLDHLAEYAKTGAAVLMVTHDSEAMEAADRKILMEGGRQL